MARHTHRPSLANVRTHTTRRTSPALAKHEMYMKLTSLEIERSRRSSERKAALDRVAMVDQRLQEIEAEQDEIRRLLETHGADSSKASRTGQPKSNGLNLNY